MSDYEWPGFFIVFILGLFLAFGPLQSRFPKFMGRLLVAGYAMRAVGCLIRYLIFKSYYDGGDAGKYFRAGVFYSESIWNLDFSFLSTHPVSGSLGTEMVMFFTGFVVSLIGPTRRGAFLLFSIISFLGLLLFLKTFQQNYPNADPRRYAKWLFFWPSLWFWPSSIGKDALVLFATSLVMYGYGGSRIRWISIILGLVIAGLIRPHVASVLVVALAIAHWLSIGTKWSVRTFIQGVVLIALAGYVVAKSANQLGVEADVEGMTEFSAKVQEQTAIGGSAIESPGLSLQSVPLAFINILCRPFPWEAGSIVTAAAALEILVFWVMVIRRRRTIFRLFKEWRKHKILRFGLPLTLLYVLMLGMAISNLGIIARQRIHVWPMLLLLFEAIPKDVRILKKPRPTVPVPTMASLGKPA